MQVSTLIQVRHAAHFPAQALADRLPRGVRRVRRVGHERCVRQKVAGSVPCIGCFVW